MLLSAEVLGSLRLLADGLAIDVGGPRQRRLLGALLVERGSIVSIDRLIEAVFEGRPPDAAQRTFRTYVARLRRAIDLAGVDAGAVIVTHPMGYSVEGGSIDVDSDRFERGLAEGQARLEAGDFDGADVCLAEALALWSGPAYGEFADEEWALVEANRLGELRFLAQERRFEAVMESGRHASAIPDIEALIEAVPFREEPRRLMMTALYRSGRHADALRAGQGYRRFLAEETGLDPSRELDELERLILEQDPRLDARPRGRRLRGYALGPPISENELGVTYRATQTSVGRDVAVTAIPADLADDPQFVRRFEVHAQHIASIEHPNVVALYDYWREPGAAYLVTRLLTGGTLEQLVEQGSMDDAQRRAVLSDVGGALAAAHERGVFHGRLDAAHVMLDERGTAYLTGFALDAVLADLHSDIAAFGRLAVAIWERPGGRGTGDGAAATTRLELVSARAGGIGDGPSYATVTDLLVALESAVSDPAHPADERLGVRPSALDGPNPYRGLFAFAETDTEVFFGREQVIAELLADLDAHPFLAVVGPSGSGKSSVVRAGLLPQLRRSGALVATMLPGSRPLAELGVALSRVASSEVPDLYELLAVAPSTFGAAVRGVLPGPADRLVLVIDQFEEAFTESQADERDAMLAALAIALEDEDPWLTVIVTIRADVLGRVLEHAAFGRLTRDHARLLTPLDVEEMHAAITGPAEAAGVAVEAPLASALVVEASASPGSLPLLQYALTELYERRSEGTMTFEAYQRLGGMAAVLTQRVEEIYSTLGSFDRDASRRLFSRLVVPGEGAGDSRRRAHLSEIVGVPDQLLELYGSSRLLAFDRDPVTREPTVEVAHEALLREWPRLTGWIEEDRDGLRLVRRLGAAAVAWEASEHGAGEMYRDARLVAADEWDTAHPGELSPLERSFLDASRAARDVRENVERRRIRRLRALLGVVAAVAVVALAATVVALGQRSDAVESTRQLDLRRLVAESRSAVDVDPSRALLLALEAHRLDPSSDSLGALQIAVAGTPHDWLGDVVASEPYRRVEFLLGDRVVAGGQDGIDVWRVATSELVDHLAFDAPVADLDVSTGGEWLAVATSSGDWSVVETADLTAVASGRAGSGITAVRIDATNGVVALGRDDGQVETSSVSNPGATRLFVAMHDGDATTDPVTEVDLSPDGRYLAAAWGGDHEALQWTLADGVDAAQPLGAPHDAVLVRYADDVLYTASSELLAFDPDSREPVGSPVASLGALFPDLSLRPTGPGLLAIVGGGTIIDIDVAAGSVVGSRSYESGMNLGDGSLSADGRVGAMTNATGISLWARDGRGRFVDHVVPPPPEPTTNSAITGDGRFAVQAGNIRDGIPARIWNLSSSDPDLVLELPPGHALRAVGNDIVEFQLDEGGEALAFHRWDPSIGSLEPLITAPLGTFGVNIPLLTPDRRSFLHPWNNGQGILDVHDLRSGKLVAHLDDVERAAPPFTTIAGVPTLSPDGRWLVFPTSGEYVAVYDAITWELVDLLEPDVGFSEIVFTTDGAAITHSTRGLERRQPGDLRNVVLGPVPGEGAPAAGAMLEITADGRMLKTAGDQGPRLWDADTLTPIGGRFPHDPGTWAATLAATTDQLATVVDGAVVVWNIDLPTWPELACLAVGRNLTGDEWRELGPRGPYHVTCEQWPSG